MMTAPRPTWIHVDPRAPDAAALSAAAACVRAGGLVAFPTETVYGLGARADMPEAIERLCRVKQRPDGKPFTVHLASADAARALPVVWPAAAEALSRQFWPGPLTLVVPHRDGGTVGVRGPRHPVALAFLAAAGVPIVAPSANRSGQAPPTTAEAVAAALGDDVDYILDGGPTEIGESSTVVDCTVTPPKIVRAGAAHQAIATVLAQAMARGRT